MVSLAVLYHSRYANRRGRTTMWRCQDTARVQTRGARSVDGIPLDFHLRLLQDLTDAAAQELAALVPLA